MSCQVAICGTGCRCGSPTAPRITNPGILSNVTLHAGGLAGTAGDRAECQLHPRESGGVTKAVVGTLGPNPDGQC